mmetsp:Transcript_18214/g.56741  ORF Transcript_18214/g.56741 Transcript_18214/m.56741 type:complete len:216 (+) Transcript_18214:468-1115(+)
MDRHVRPLRRARPAPPPARRVAVAGLARRPQAAEGQEDRHCQAAKGGARVRVQPAACLAIHHPAHRGDARDGRPVRCAVWRPVPQQARAARAVCAPPPRRRGALLLLALGDAQPGAVRARAQASPRVHRAARAHRHLCAPCRIYRVQPRPVLDWLRAPPHAGLLRRGVGCVRGARHADAPFGLPLPMGRVPRPAALLPRLPPRKVQLQLWQRGAA